MEIFLIFLLALIGVSALIGILIAVKILHFLDKNDDKKVADIAQDLKTRFMHFFLTGTYFTILCLIYMIISVYMR